MVRLALGIVLLMIAACKHPLAIVGDGDIVDREGGGFGCTLEQFRAGDTACADNDVQGDYFPVYSAEPRAGWQFSHWEGSCGQLSVPPECRFDVPAAWVVYWDTQYGDVPIPALTAVFEPIPNANSRSYTYDAAGRLSSVIYGNGAEIHYTYDKAGNRLTRQVSAPPE